MRRRSWMTSGSGPCPERPPPGKEGEPPGGARGAAEFAAKGIVEVAVRGEAGLDGDPADRLPTLEHRLESGAQPELEDDPVDADTLVRRHEAAEVEGRAPDLGGNPGEGQADTGPPSDDFAHPGGVLGAAAVGPRSGRWPPTGGADDGQPHRPPHERRGDSSPSRMPTPHPRRAGAWRSGARGRSSRRVAREPAGKRGRAASAAAGSHATSSSRRPASVTRNTEHVSPPGTGWVMRYSSPGCQKRAEPASASVPTPSHSRAYAPWRVTTTSWPSPSSAGGRDRSWPGQRQSAPRRRSLRAGAAGGPQAQRRGAGSCAGFRKRGHGGVARLA